MATVTKRLNVDVARKNLFDPVVMKQNDVDSRFLQVQLMDEGTALAIDTAAAVSINVKRPDGSAQTFDGTVNGDGTATVPIPPWALELAGELCCDVSVTQNDQRLTSMAFRVDVQRAVFSGAEIIQEE